MGGKTYVALQSALEDQLFSHGDVDEGGATKIESCSERGREKGSLKGFARAGSSAKPDWVACKWSRWLG